MHVAPTGRMHFYRENQREALGLVERDSAMSRVSKPSRASAIFVTTAASLAAVTAYNIYRARKVEREHPPTGRFVTIDGVRLHYIEKGEGRQSSCSTATWLRLRISEQAECWNYSRGDIA
jgi:hypothetical protein